MRRDDETMRYCAFCANEITDEVDSCPFCGKKLPKQGAAKAAAEDVVAGASTGSEAPLTYPLPAAGEGATVRGFAPVTLPPRTPSGAADDERPTTAPAVNVAAAPTLLSSDVITDPAAALGTDAPLVPPAITAPVDGQGPGVPIAPTPASPSQPMAGAAPSREPQAVTYPGVAPMPEAPVGLMQCIPYVFAVVSARRLRAAAKRDLDGQIEAEKHKVHEVLRDLGQAARRASPTPDVARDEIARLIALEEERSRAEQAKGALDAELSAEEERFVQSEGGHRSTAEAHRAELTAAQGDLQQVDAEIARHQQVLQEHEKRRVALLKERDHAEARAQKAEDTAEKEVLIRSAAEKDVAMQEVAQAMGIAESALATASAPRAALEQRVLAARAGLEQAQAAIAAARQQLEARRKVIDEQRRQGGMQVTRLEREIMHAQVVVGSTLDTHRPPSEDGGFEEHYGRIDSHRRLIDEKMRQISQLDMEAESYDRAAHKKGLSLLGGGVGLLALIILILVLVL